LPPLFFSPLCCAVYRFGIPPSYDWISRKAAFTEKGTRCFIFGVANLHPWHFNTLRRTLLLSGASREGCKRRCLPWVPHGSVRPSRTLASVPLFSIVVCKQCGHFLFLFPSSAIPQRDLPTPRASPFSAALILVGTLHGKRPIALLKMMSPDRGSIPFWRFERFSLNVGRPFELFCSRFPSFSISVSARLKPSAWPIRLLPASGTSTSKRDMLIFHRMPIRSANRRVRLLGLCLFVGSSRGDPFQSILEIHGLVQNLSLSLAKLLVLVYSKVFFFPDILPLPSDTRRGSPYTLLLLVRYIFGLLDYWFCPFDGVSLLLFGAYASPKPRSLLAPRTSLPSALVVYRWSVDCPIFSRHLVPHSDPMNIRGSELYSGSPCPPSSTLPPPIASQPPQPH